MPYLMVGRAAPGEQLTKDGKRSIAPRAMGSSMFHPIPAGADVYTLPTLAELYMHSQKRAVPNSVTQERHQRRAKGALPKARIHGRRH